MKKLLLGFAALLIAATFVFAFTPKHNTFAIEYRSFSTSVAQPPSKSDLTNQSNWSSALSSNPCAAQTGQKICGISFDDAVTNLADAIDALPNGVTFSNGQTFTDANGAVITVYTRP